MASEEGGVSAGDLCLPRLHNGTLVRCGRTVLERDPATEEAYPSYGGGGIFVCVDCGDIFMDFMKGAYDARAHRMEWEGDFDPLPE